jgi:hypothetical protein
METNKKFDQNLAAAASRVFMASEGEDNCPKCDHPAPIVGGWCQCGNCGHIWRAGSH